MSIARFIPYGLVVLGALVSTVAAASMGSLTLGVVAAVLLGLAGLGAWDLVQTRHAILRSYPLIGHARYMLESIRPEIRQYFIEDDLDGRPYNREQRSLIYQRAKGEKDYDPFGSELDTRAVGYEWIGHSITARPGAHEAPKVPVGEGRCAKPYSISLLNVSAMSFGSLGPSAVRAMGRGAKQGGFAHNTGEGGVSKYHLETGADLVWQIGTGYFGCRASDGGFDPAQFEERSRLENVAMVEVKLSQGAKPGHGGILPAHKVTEEIAEARAIPVGKSCLSPPGHSAFSTPSELVAFVDRLRDLSGGKPIGIKLCVGEPHELLAILKAMRDADGGPDFISVDGGEGGTGAAPPEFGDHIGTPLEEGLVFVHNALLAAGLRDRVRVGASGKVVSGMDLARCIALGADYMNAARSFMMSVGCIQAQLCHTNHCPAGVATLDPLRNRGLDPTDKGVRAARYQAQTVHSLLELVGAAGLDHPHELTADRIHRRVSPSRVIRLDELYPAEQPGALLNGTASDALQRDWDSVNGESFALSR